MADGDCPPSEGRKNAMSTNVPPVIYTIGPDGAPTVVAVDDAWFEGNSHDNVLPLDRIVGIRQSTSLQDLIARCKSRAANHSLGDLDYLQCLAELCLQQSLRLSLCNFEHAESRFGDLNQTGQAALFDVNYANVKDKDYGPKLLAAKLNGGKPKADFFIVTGYGITYQELLRKHAHDPKWWTLKKWVNPIVAKGESRDMQATFKGFALNFSARASKERYQFWANPGDSSWTIVFNGQQTTQTIDVETTYLAVLVAHPNCPINAHWLDMINEAAHGTSARSKQVRLFIAGEYLRRLANPSVPPSPTADSSVTLPEHTPLEQSESDTDSAATVPSWPEKQALVSGRVDPLPGGCDGIITMGPEPTMIEEYEEEYARLKRASERNPTADTRRLREMEEVLAELKAWLPTVERKVAAQTAQPSSEFKKLKFRIQKAFARARQHFADFKTKDDDVITKLSDHFTHALPQGKPRKPMVFQYSPTEPTNWTCFPPD